MAIKNLYQDSRYPMEKIGFVASGSFNIVNGSQREVVVTSNPTGVPLMLDGIYSLDNWQTSYPLMTEDKNSIFVPFWWFGETDAVRVTYTAYANATMRYKIWAYTDEELNETIPKTNNVSQSKFIIQNKNYMRILMSGVTYQDTETIYHNLGYIPFFKAWSAYIGGYFIKQDAIYVDEQKIIVKPYTAYRVYINEA